MNDAVTTNAAATAILIASTSRNQRSGDITCDAARRGRKGTYYQTILRSTSAACIHRKAARSLWDGRARILQPLSFPPRKRGGQGGVLACHITRCRRPHPGDGEEEERHC